MSPNRVSCSHVVGYDNCPTVELERVSIGIYDEQVELELQSSTTTERRERDQRVYDVGARMVRQVSSLDEFLALAKSTAPMPLSPRAILTLPTLTTTAPLL